MWHNGKDSPRVEDDRTPRKPPEWNTDHFLDEEDPELIQPTDVVRRSSVNLPWLRRISDSTVQNDRTTTSNDPPSSNNNKNNSSSSSTYEVHMSSEGVAHLVLQERLHSTTNIPAGSSSADLKQKMTHSSVQNNSAGSSSLGELDKRGITAPISSNSPVPQLNLSKTSPGVSQLRVVTGETEQSNENKLLGTWNGRSISMDTTIIIGSPRIMSSVDESVDAADDERGRDMIKMGGVDLRTSGTRIQAYIRQNKTVNSKFGEKKSIGRRIAIMSQREYDDDCSSTERYAGERPVLRPSPRKRAKFEDDPPPLIPTPEEEERQRHRHTYGMQQLTSRFAGGDDDGDDDALHAQNY